MVPQTPDRPVIGAIALDVGKPAMSERLKEIARMGMTMCETILFRGDTSPERRKDVLAVLDEAAALNISVLLEPTYQPDPESLDVCAVTSDDESSSRGDGWGGFCYRRKRYLEELAQFTEEVCRYYMGHPAVLSQKGRPVLAIGHEMQYQISSEDGHGDPIKAMTCYCTDCVTAFRSWLSDRYAGDVNAFNEAHETHIESFDTVKPPREPLPDRVLWQEWVDHHATAIPEAIRLQRDIIEREVPGALVTHEINDWYPNTWDCIYAGNNFWMMGRELEHAFNDQYPMEWAPGSLWRIYLYTFTQDATQSSFDFEKNFWTNGQSFSSWQGDFSDPPTEGHTEQVYSALIHGANGLFWWTSSELLPTTEEASREYAKLVEMVGDARPKKDPVALLVPWTTYAQTRSADRGDDLMGGYQLLSRLGYQVEVIDESQIAEGVLEDRGYRVLCTWGNSSLLPDVRTRIEEFVHKGGMLLADYGDTDTAPYTPVFPETIGRTIGVPLAYELADGSKVLVRSCAHALTETDDSTVLATYAHGLPAAARYRIGDGVMLRIGSLAGLDYAEGMGIYDWVHQERVRIDAAMETFIGNELAEFGVTPLAWMSNPNMEAALLPIGDSTVVLAVNHLRHPAKADLTLRTDATKATDALTGEAIEIVREDGVSRIRLSFESMGGRAVRLE